MTEAKLTQSDVRMEGMQHGGWSLVNQQYPSKVEMLCEYCNHKELELKESLTDTASLCRGEGCKSYVFMVKKYCLISKSSKKLVA